MFFFLLFSIQSWSCFVLCKLAGVTFDVIIGSPKSTKSTISLEIYGLMSIIPNDSLGTLRKHDGDDNDNARKQKAKLEQKQSLCTCVLNFGKFLCHHALLNNNVK